MFRKICAVLMVVICLFSLCTPAFAVYDPNIFNPANTLTPEMIQSIYYTFSNLLGLRGNITNNTIGFNNSPFSIGVGQDISQWMNGLYFDMTVRTFWENIKDYFVEDGTITYSDGRTVPRWKLEVTAENENDIRLFAKSIQDAQLAMYNSELDPNYSWVDIDHIYGGYFSYAEQFVGSYLYGTDSNNQRKEIINNPLGDYSSFGLDLYLKQNDSYAELLMFNSDTDTCTWVQKPFSTLSMFGGYNKQYTYTIVYPFSVTNANSVKITLSEPDTSINGTGSCGVYYRNICLLTSAQYEAWQERIATIGNWDVGASSYTCKIYWNDAEKTQTATVSGGTFYLLAQLYFYTGPQSGSSKRGTIVQNKNYKPENYFTIDIGETTLFGVTSVNGIGRLYNWSVDVTDSGTGTTTTYEDAVSTVLPNVFDVGSVLYFPGYVANVPEFVEVLNSDVAVTGEIAVDVTDDPSNPSNESVSIDIVPPSALGLDSIWHYVSDSYNYVSGYIIAMVGTVFTIIPTPVFNLAFAAVVLGILFGLYKRFIE